MPIRVDFTDVQDTGFTPLDVGTYNAVVFDAGVREGRTSGKPYVNWEMKIVDGDSAGRRAWYTTSLQPQSLWKLRQVLVNLGTNPEELEGDFELELADYIGRTCRIVIGHEEYNGEVRDRVVDVLPAGEDGDSLGF